MNHSAHQPDSAGRKTFRPPKLPGTMNMAIPEDTCAALAAEAWLALCHLRADACTRAGAALAERTTGAKTAPVCDSSGAEQQRDLEASTLIRAKAQLDSKYTELAEALGAALADDTPIAEPVAPSATDAAGALARTARTLTRARALGWSTPGKTMCDHVDPERARGATLIARTLGAEACRLGVVEHRYEAIARTTIGTFKALMAKSSHLKCTVHPLEGDGPALGSRAGLAIIVTNAGDALPTKRLHDAHAALCASSVTRSGEALILAKRLETTTVRWRVRCAQSAPEHCDIEVVGTCREDAIAAAQTRQRQGGIDEWHESTDGCTPIKPVSAVPIGAALRGWHKPITRPDNANTAP